jgi:hypothetical protein
MLMKVGRKSQAIESDYPRFSETSEHFEDLTECQTEIDAA